MISIGSYSKESTYTDQGIRVDYNVKTKNRILNHADLAMILNDKTSSGDIIGRVLYIDRDNTYVYNQRTERIEPNQDIYNSYFLYQMLNAPMIRAKIIKLAQGNTQIYVNWSSVNQLLYKVPSILEQLKIVMLLKNVDTLIAANEDKHKNAFNIRRRFITSILS